MCVWCKALMPWQRVGIRCGAPISPLLSTAKRSRRALPGTASNCRRPPGIHYVGFVDTGGSGSDAMSLATAHHDRTYGPRRAPGAPRNSAAAELADTLTQYRCY